MLNALFNTPVSEASPAFGPMEPMTPDYGDLRAPIDTSARDADRQELLRLLSQVPQQQGPVKATQPAFRTPDAIIAGVAALAALLGGKNGGQAGGALVSGLLQGKMGKARQDTELAQDQADFSNQQSMFRQNADLNVAKTKLGFSESDVNEAEANRIREDNEAERKLFKDQQRFDKEINGAMSLYSRAKTLPDMLAHARRWRDAETRSGSQIITAPTDEEVQSSFVQKSSMERDRITDNYQRYLESEKKDNFGTVSEAGAARINRARKQAQDELGTYGIADAYLPEPPTEKTKQLEIKEQLMADAKTKLRKQLSVMDQQILASKAAVQRAKERVEIARSQVATGQFNGDTRRMEYELRMQTQKHNKTAQGAVNRIQAQINGEKAKQSKTVSGSEKRSIEAKVIELAAERDFWKGQMEAEPAPNAPTQGRSAGMNPQEVSTKVDETRKALAAGKITQAQAEKIYKYLKSQGPASR